MSSRHIASRAPWIPILSRAPDIATRDGAPTATTAPRTVHRRTPVSWLEWTLLLVAAMWVIVLAFVRWPVLLHTHFNSNSTIDSAFFALAGQLVRDGQVPYVAFWDHKPPLIYFIDAFALTLSGGAVWGIWLVAVVALVATLGMTWLAWRPVVGPTAAVIGITWVAFSVGIVSPFNLTEGFVLPIQAAALIVLSRWSPLRRSAFVSGVLLGILGALAFLLRPNLIGTSAVVVATMVIGLMLTRRTRKLPLLFVGGAAGAILVIAPVLLWLNAHDALRPFWDQVFHYNALYSATSWKSRARSAFEGVALSTAHGTLLLPLIGWIVAAYRLAVRNTGAAPKAALLFGVIWAPMEIALAAVPGRTYMHYFATLLLPFGFLTAIAACEAFGAVERAVSPAAMRRWRRNATLILCGGIAIAPIGWAAIAVRDAGLERGERAQQVNATVRYVRANSAAGSRLLVWGHAADVYLFANRRPASRFVYPLAMLTPKYADSALVATFLDDLRTSAPPLIIDATPGTSESDDLVPSLAAWNPHWRYPESGVAWWTMTPALRRFYDHVATNYSAIGTVGPQHWIIYARRENLLSVRHP